MNSVLDKIRGGIIVSCQTKPPLSDTRFIASMCQAVVEEGAVGLRVNSPANVRAVKEILDVPVIGINKIRYENSQIYITPTIKSALDVVEAGAEIVALDGINLPRPDGSSLATITSEIHSCNSLVMADIATLEEGIYAATIGVDIVATTLSGYTPQSKDRYSNEPDFELLEELCNTLDCPVIAEGRIFSAKHVEKAYQLGAFSVVVGKAITEPRVIVKEFISAASNFLEEETI